MRIAIVDDLKSDRDITKIYLEQYLNSSNISFEVEEFTS